MIRNERWLLLVIVLLLISCPFLSSQEAQKSKNALYPDELLVACDVKFSKDAFGSMNNFRLPPGKTFPCLYVDKALNGKLEMLHPDFPDKFYPYGDSHGRLPYDSTGLLVKLDLIPVDDQAIIPDDYTMTYDPDELGSVLFIEAWYYDEEKFIFNKDVKYIIPVRYSEGRYGRIEKRKLLEFSNKDAGTGNGSRNLELLGRIQYEFHLGEEMAGLPESCREGIESGNITIEKVNSPFWSSYSRQKLITTVLDKVMTGQEKAYIPGSDIELDVDGIKRAFGAEDLLIEIPDIEDPRKMKDTLITRDINLYEIRSILFIEDWYLNPESMYLEKKVRGLGPIRHYIDPRISEKEYNKRIAFVVRLREE